MKTIYIRKKDAVYASCNSGRYFVRRMFKVYGQGNGIELSLELLKAIIRDFEIYMEQTTIEDLSQLTVNTHIRCYLDCLLEIVPTRIVPTRANIFSGRYSNAWNTARRSSNSTIILRAFWKELKRISK